MARTLIGLGSNLGQRAEQLQKAVAMLNRTPGVQGVVASRWHETAAIGGPVGQGAFLNGAARVETSLSPADLFSRLGEIEHALGRDRGPRWQPRTIDLDLLLYDDAVRQDRFILPHPRMAFRRFVLEPAAEIAPAMVHPTIGWTIEKLLDHLRTAPPYVAVCGSDVAATRRLATACATPLGWRVIQRPGAADGTSVDSPSLTLARALELLREQAQLLAPARLSSQPGGMFSAFWIEELLAIGDRRWPGELDHAWQSLAPRVTPPKLLVVYEGSSRGELWERYLRRASRRGIGPVLRLKTDDVALAETELIAAIQAMQ